MTVVELPAETRTEPVEVTVGDVLERAADLLEEFGWCRHAYAIDADGVRTDSEDAPAILRPDVQAFCAGGAYYRAARELGILCKSPGDAERAVELAFGIIDDFKQVGAINGWNDAPGRTKGEVVARLRDAARAARAR